MASYCTVMTGRKGHPNPDQVSHYNTNTRPSKPTEDFRKICLKSGDGKGETFSRYYKNTPAIIWRIFKSTFKIFHLCELILMHVIDQVHGSLDYSQGQ